MKIKMEFKRKDNGVVEQFELHPQDVTRLNAAYIATMSKPDNDVVYAWPFGSCNIFESRDNILCAQFIETEYLKLEYINE